MAEQSIQQLADTLQKQIDTRLKVFNENHDKLKALHEQAEELEKIMADVVLELEPVECLIYTQNPTLQKLFESLKRVYGKDNCGSDTEAH